MNEALTEALKEAYALAPADKVILHTLEIRQDGVQQSLRIVQGMTGITATDENDETHSWQPVGFRMALPPSNEEGFQSLSLSIDNIDRQVTDFITVAKSEMVPIVVKYRPFLLDDLTRPQMNPPVVLYLRDIQISAMQVTAKATFMDIINKKFPSELYTRDRFPTLG